ncbi:CsxC family protein [Sporosalibacterium faouarense]|uniref:CsxC family protein n=1 Tax=Sporosalibacterium faouarense TaxID=516123 RepID=UPI00141CFB16|nr:hypothetical protein [Sporosalibacterium faouarense]MTI46526.1 hypothetical protein [Bacillota bacterium]
MAKNGKASVSNVEVSLNNVQSKANANSESNNNILNHRDYCADVHGGTVESCDNISTDITPITSGVVAKIPVVLSEFTVRIAINSKIELPEPAIEIKNIKKRVKITQCLLLQNTNVLFIKGFIRKNIDYSTRDCSNKKAICGDIHHCTVDVPFQCTTIVAFNGTTPAPVVTNTQSEFEYFRRQELPREFAEKDKLLAGDLSEYNQMSTENLNELPFCELISSRIVEFDEYLNRTPIYKPHAPFEEKEFEEIEEKMVVFLTLKLLQNRQVAIGSIGGIVRPCEDC